MFHLKLSWLTILFIVIAIGISAVFAAGLWVVDSYREAKVARLSGCDSKEADGRLLKAAENLSGLKIVFLGDSRVWDWALSNTLPESISVVNLGRPGETTPELLCRRGEILANQNTWVVLQAGINDLVAASMSANDAARTDIEVQALKNVVAIAEDLIEGGHQLVVMSIAPPINPDIARQIVWGDGIEKSVERFNRELLASLEGRVLIIDIKEILYNAETQSWNGNFARDALHWTPQAYEILSEKLTQLVQP